jgi:hypothetical protein
LEFPRGHFDHLGSGSVHEFGDATPASGKKLVVVAILGSVEMAHDGAKFLDLDHDFVELGEGFTPGDNASDAFVFFHEAGPL